MCQGIGVEVRGQLCGVRSSTFTRVLMIKLRLPGWPNNPLFVVPLFSEAGSLPLNLEIVISARLADQQALRSHCLCHPKTGIIRMNITSCFSK